MSRIPGVLEEIVLSVKAGQPVFLIGAFGGVAKLVIDLIRGKTAKKQPGITKRAHPSLPKCAHSMNSAASNGSTILQ